MPWQPLRCGHLPNKLGFDGYDQFKQVFQSTINDPSFESRASWVQQSSEAEGLPSVVHDLAESGYNNIQHFYQNLDMQAISRAGDLIINASTVYVVAAGGVHWMATY